MLADNMADTVTEESLGVPHRPVTYCLQIYHKNLQQNKKKIEDRQKPLVKPDMRTDLALNFHKQMNEVIVKLQLTL